MKINICCLILFMTGCWCSPCGKAKSIQSFRDPVVRPDTSGNDGNSRKQFMLFHLVRYHNTPADLMPYLHPTKIANEKMLLNQDGSPSSTAVKAFATSCPPHIPVTLDLETWPYWPQPKLERTIQNFLQVIKAFKRVNTTSPIGFYGVPPKQAYQWEKIDPVNNPRGYAGWKGISDNLSPVAEKVDIFLPSFYTYNPDTAGWHKMVDTTIAAIKRYNKLKPVYAYIWPQYHEGTSIYSLQFIDTAIWRYQLEVLYHKVDGCIIWTSNKDNRGNTLSWNPDMPWWQTTKSFLVDKGLVPPFVLDSFKLVHTGKKVELQWSTSVDTTTRYFIVQHSKDNINFEPVSGHILSLQAHYQENDYQYTDEHPLKGTLYYRLRITDKKGNSIYSKAISNKS